MNLFHPISRPLLLTLALGSWLLHPASAQDAPGKTKKDSGELKFSNFPGQVMEEILIPIPSEIFGVLEKLGNPDWKKEIVPSTKTKFTGRPDVALLLGAVVADGFLAVQAQDSTLVESIGREVLDLSKGLGVQDAVLPHCNAIQEAAKAKNWDAVRRELDATQRTVRETMEKMKDKALAECVSVGGWLRGTQVVTNIIMASYTEDKAELLNQPDLADYFYRNMEKSLAQLPKSEKLIKISSGLKEIRDLMVKSNGVLKQDSVATVNRITGDLVKRMTSKK